LKGIVSASFTSNGHCDVSGDAIFTNVMKFAEWIHQVSKQVNSKTEVCGYQLQETETEKPEYEKGNQRLTRRKLSRLMESSRKI
jgi:regulator of replication initiation timing